MIILSCICFCLLNKDEIREKFDNENKRGKTYNLEEFIDFSNGEGLSKNYALMYHKTFNPKNFLKTDFGRIEGLLNRWRDGNVKVLDAGCGSGRYMNNLLSRNISVVGVDKIKSMIEAAKLYLSKFGRGVNLHVGDMKNEDLFNPHQFTHILATRDTLNWNKNLKQLFKNFHFWLKPNGYVYVHLMNKDKPVISPCDMAFKYTSQEGREHAQTIFSNYIHDAFWGNDNDDSSRYYYQKYTFQKNKKQRNYLSKIKMFLFDRNSVVAIANKCGLKLVNHYPGQIEGLLFQKKKNYHANKFKFTL